MPLILNAEEVFQLSLCRSIFCIVHIGSDSTAAVTTANQPEKYLCRGLIPAFCTMRVSNRKSVPHHASPVPSICQVFAGSEVGVETESGEWREGGNKEGRSD